MDLRFIYNKYFRHAVEVDGILYDMPYGGPGEIAVAKMGEEFLEPYLLKKSRGIFVDAGANIGGWSLKASPFYDKVHAFEPNKRIARKLERTIYLNGARNIYIYGFALGAKTGYESQRIEHRSQPLSDSVGDMLPVEGVYTVAYDELDLDDIAAFKIDVEGAGRKVALGALNSIESCLPTIVAECHTKDEMEIPSILPSSYRWNTIWRVMPDKYPSYDAIINGQQPFLIGVSS